MNIEGFLLGQGEDRRGMKKKELRRQIAQLRSQIRAVQLENSSLRLELSCREWHIRNLNVRDALRGRFDT